MHQLTITMLTPFASGSALATYRRVISKPTISPQTFHLTSQAAHTAQTHPTSSNSPQHTFPHHLAIQKRTYQRLHTFPLSQLCTYNHKLATVISRKHAPLGLASALRVLGRRHHVPQDREERREAAGLRGVGAYGVVGLGTPEVCGGEG
jgi:hypothetical protein